jgi:hypothetical protein
MKKLSILAMTGTVHLAGCAIHNSDQDININSALWYGSMQCSHAGLMDQNTAAQGMAIAMSNIYREDTPRVQAKVREFASENHQTTANECEAVSLRIKTLAASKALATTRSPAPVYVPPKTTNCYTVEGWTHCTQF